MNVGVVPLETLKSHDGASFLTKIMEGDLPLPPIMDTLGFHPHVVEEGRVVFTGMPEHRHYNPIGSVHAGFALTLLDSCVACAVHSSCKRGEGYTTLELKSNFVRPSPKRQVPYLRTDALSSADAAPRLRKERSRTKRVSSMPTPRRPA